MGILIAFSSAKLFCRCANSFPGEMSLDEIKEKGHGHVDGTKEAFEELCSMVEALNAEREERREAALARFQARRAYSNRLREKNQKLRASYLALLDQYNALVEEVKERSDSSSSSDSDDDDTCCIM